MWSGVRVAISFRSYDPPLPSLCPHKTWESSDGACCRGSAGLCLVIPSTLSPFIYILSMPVILAVTMALGFFLYDVPRSCSQSDFGRALCFV